MTDQTPADLADKVRKLAARFRQQIDPHVSFAEYVVWERAAEAVENLLPAPSRPTLADMTDEERAACRWMQCDYGEPGRSQSRGVIGYFDYGEKKAIILTTVCGIVRRDYDLVTPRPDLPRMEWPGNEKPAPVPALPDGWRLADHRKYGRVIVTDPTPNRDGYVYCVFSSDRDRTGFDWHPYDPEALTYIDQEADQ